MAYLPGVPDMSPAPVSTSAVEPGQVAGGNKNVRTQHLGSVVGQRGAGMSTITGGNAALHSLGHYGKNPPGWMGGDQTMVRDSSGGVRRHVRQGGLGPGKMSAAGPSDTDYSMNSSDTE